MHLLLGQLHARIRLILLLLLGQLGRLTAFDDTASTQLKHNWVVAVVAAVKLGAIYQLALHDHQHTSALRQQATNMLPLACAGGGPAAMNCLPEADQVPDLLLKKPLNACMYAC